MGPVSSLPRRTNRATFLFLFCLFFKKGLGFCC